MIIIDEVSMCSRHMMNAVDRFLQELMKNNLPFGGKLLLFSGDFMQTLPVIRHGTRAETVSSTIKYCKNWNSIEKFSLLVNMRVSRESFDFAEWLLKIGQGIASQSTEEEYSVEDIVDLPRECIVSKEELVQEIFGNNISPVEMRKYGHRAILTRKMKTHFF